MLQECLGPSPTIRRRTKRSTASSPRTPGPLSFYGPGYFDIDATLFKDFVVREHMQFSVGIQAGNVMNHPHFSNPNGTSPAWGFGSIHGTAGQPTSPYGAFQGSAVSGHMVGIGGRFNF